MIRFPAAVRDLSPHQSSQTGRGDTQSFLLSAKRANFPRG